jgi:hypothetical protein
MTRSFAIGICLLSAAVIGCEGGVDNPTNNGEGTESIAAHLYEGPNVVFWPGGHVPVCFSSTTPLPSQEEQWIKQILSQPTDTVRDSWSAVATIDFTFQDGCPFVGASSWVEVQGIEFGTWQGGLGPPDPGPSQWGYGAVTSRLGFGAGATVIQMDYCDTTDCLTTSLADYKEEVRQTIIHEMGHVLGFLHEQQRPDYTTIDCEWDDPINNAGNNQTVTGGSYLSILDRDSVMNYCRRSIIHPGPYNDEYIGFEVGYHGGDTISAGDTIGSQTAYPPKRFPYWFAPASQNSLL